MSSQAFSIHALMTRPFRRGICPLLIGVVLFAQLAVAAYACPGMSIGASVGSTAMVGMADAATPADTMPGCEQSDPAAPTLCAAHCQAEPQSSGQTQLPPVPSMLPTSCFVVPVRTHSDDLAHASVAPDRPAVASSPPHAILHCCFRI